MVFAILIDIPLGCCSGKLEVDTLSVAAFGRALATRIHNYRKFEFLKQAFWGIGRA